jgi:predicted transcriptional regulator YdeE
MEVIQISDDIRAMGFQVRSFPHGIGEAFEALADKIDDGLNRAYFGIAYMSATNEPIYQAAAEILEAGEPTQYHLETYIIEKGNYLAATLRDWHKNIHKIKEIFTEITRDSRVRNSPCIEWYKDDDEMICMVKLNG